MPLRDFMTRRTCFGDRISWTFLWISIKKIMNIDFDNSNCRERRKGAA